MATKPTFPRWATDDQVDVISGQSNVEEPPEDRKDAGWVRHEVPPRQWLNWVARQTYLALQYFEDSRGQLESYDSTLLPLAADNEGRMVYVSDLQVPAYSDGTDWRRVTDGSTI